MKPTRYITALILAGAAITGCDQPGAVQTGTPTGVVSVNYPLHYFAERITGGAVPLHFPVPADGDPAFWRPDDAAISIFQRADVILLNGADYAKWRTYVSLPESRCVDTSAAFSDRFIVISNAVTHTHGPEGEHSHGDLAFTTWLDLHQAAQQAEAVHDALRQQWPEHEKTFRKGFIDLRADLQGLDQRLKDRLALLGNQPLLGSHPVYQYLARRYELNLQSVHWEPGVLPPEPEWQKLAALLKIHPARTMIWEDSPLPETMAKLKTLGIEILVVEPCGNRPVKRDFLEVMRRNVAGLELLVDAKP